MSEPDTREAGGTGSGPTGPDSATDASSPAGQYAGPGAWGAAALWLLGVLFALSAAATVHSILATFGG